jgi:hypothetical protein
MGDQIRSEVTVPSVPEETQQHHTTTFLITISISGQFANHCPFSSPPKN